ncbi:histidine kinase [Kitasatospora sp. MMS16-BH015]|uniref:sensor histidine kinase n=1 Tax=Kitasatospora sp. MMS16-BH015 TaxID=2018025 RepID=UPI000CA37C0F|nr:histidine kinase [Kitasatospora sp. MMS16-BH015]AUG76547.1 histidine kinase [Kitasatospora sp. MMS16-BH015]
MGGTEAGWLLAALLATGLAAGGLAVALARAERRHRAALEERGWLLERERARAARAAVAAEQARIARELHDIVSHNVSVMVIQAGAARQVLARQPEAAVAALLAVEGAGRDAMTELRTLLGVLAPSADGRDGPYEDETVEAGAYERAAAEEALGPQPGLDRLSPLIDRVAFAGLPVEVRISGEPRRLPAGVDLTAYRIIQEALTNALKHGKDGVKAEVTVRYAERYLRVEVLNSGPSVLAGDAAPERSPAEGAGRGLLGLRERVGVYGGELDARRRLGGGYRVRARIPLDRPAASL